MYDTLISWLPGISEVVQIASPFQSRATVSRGCEPSVKVMEPAGKAVAPGAFTKTKKVTGPGKAGFDSETMRTTGGEWLPGRGANRTPRPGK
jgi:hypothetical protein